MVPAFFHSEGIRRGDARHPLKLALCRHLGRAGLPAACCPPGPTREHQGSRPRGAHGHAVQTADTSTARGGGGWAWGWGSACWHPAGRGRVGWGTAGHGEPRVGGEGGTHALAPCTGSSGHVRDCAPRGMGMEHPLGWRGGTAPQAGARLCWGRAWAGLGCSIVAGGEGAWGCAVRACVIVW